MSHPPAPIAQCTNPKCRNTWYPQMTVQHGSRLPDPIATQQIIVPEICPKCQAPVKDFRMKMTIN